MASSDYSVLQNNYPLQMALKGDCITFTRMLSHRNKSLETKVAKDPSIKPIW